MENSNLRLLDNKVDYNIVSKEYKNEIKNNLFSTFIVKFIKDKDTCSPCFIFESLSYCVVDIINSEIYDCISLKKYPIINIRTIRLSDLTYNNYYVVSDQIQPIRWDLLEKNECEYIYGIYDRYKSTLQKRLVKKL